MISRNRALESRDVFRFFVRGLQRSPWAVQVQGTRAGALQESLKAGLPHRKQVVRALSQSAAHTFLLRYVQSHPVSLGCDIPGLLVMQLARIVVPTVKQGKPVERRGRKATGLSA